MYLFLRESPCLTLGGFRSSGNVARRGACDGRCGPDDLWVLGVSVAAGLVSVGDTVYRKIVQPGARVALLVESVLNRSSRLVVASIWRVPAQSHVVKTLIYPAVYTLSSGSRAHDVVHHSRIQGCRALESTRISTAGSCWRHHGGDAHVALPRRHQLRDHVSRDRRRCLVCQRRLIARPRGAEGMVHHA